MTYTNIRYSVMLNDAQYDYLLDRNQEIDRMMCFRTFLKMAVMEQTEVSKKNFSAVLQPGQFMASKVDLSELWQCNRKTATRIVHEFNLMGFLRSEPSNRTTIHTLKCLSVWFTNQRVVRNNFFDSNPMVKPIGKIKRDTDHVPPKNGQKTAGKGQGMPSLPVATSTAEGDGKKDAGRPPKTSTEGKEERVAETPFPSCPEDAPVGQEATPPQVTCQKTVAPDITNAIEQFLPLWSTTKESCNGDDCREDCQGNNKACLI